MHFNFHSDSIPTTDSRYIYIKEKHEKVLDDFRKYAEELTKKAGKAKGESGKANSYYRHLIRLIIGYHQIFGKEIADLSSMEAYQELNKITKLPNFNKFNQDTGHFYSATLGCFLSYLVNLNSTIEEERDDILNLDLNKNFDRIRGGDLYKELLVSKPTPRPPKTQKNGKQGYPRNEKESIAAKEHSGWRCEINPSHETFINAANLKPYVESHHLIPMAAQDLFENTIDFADNIVSLCPNCHKRIHHTLDNEKKEMLNFLYDKRKDLYPNYGIEIDIRQLYKMYGIIS